MANSNEGLSDCPVSDVTTKKGGILVICDSDGKHFAAVVGFLEVMHDLSLGDYHVISNPDGVSRMVPTGPNNHRLNNMANALTEFQNAMAAYGVKRVILFEAARGSCSGGTCVDLINVAKMISNRYGTTVGVEAYRYDNSAGFCLIEIDPTRLSVVPPARAIAVG